MGILPMTAAIVAGTCCTAPLLALKQRLAARPQPKVRCVLARPMETWPRDHGHQAQQKSRFRIVALAVPARHPVENGTQHAASLQLRAQHNSYEHRIH